MWVYLSHTLEELAEALEEFSQRCDEPYGCPHDAVSVEAQFSLLAKRGGQALLLPLRFLRYHSHHRLRRHRCGGQTLAGSYWFQ